MKVTLEKVFKRSRAKWQDEEKALADVRSKFSENASMPLVAKHTDNFFVWEVNLENTKFVRVLKTEVENENDAAHLAMQTLHTFQANLKADHTETHYVFSRIKG